jgi:hypothetical protein
MFKQLPSVDYQQLRPPHRLALCQVLANDRVICQLEMSHAITDGESTAITMNDWSKAYAGCLNSESLLNTSRGFARALKAQRMAGKTDFWHKKLAGVEPCNFPHLISGPQQNDEASTATVKITGGILAHLQRFCKTESSTPASVFQSAWALTLAAYVGTDSVCFGYLASGRDMLVPGLGESIGAYINMMICRADTSRMISGRDLVRRMRDQVLEDLNFQHCSLADIQHRLNLSPGQSLFNTILSFQTKDDEPEANGEGEGLAFVDIAWEDPTEVRNA